MKTKIWLDDIRLCSWSDVWDNWIEIRSYNSLVEYITKNSIKHIDEISFDHDLGNDKTGYDCAKWLVEQGITFDRYSCHSSNPVGKENILSYLDRYAVIKRESSYTFTKKELEYVVEMRYTCSMCSHAIARGNYLFCDLMPERDNQVEHGGMCKKIAIS